MKKNPEKATKKKRASLNMIYYFDGGRTHTLALSPIWIKFLLFFLLLLLAWATIGSFFFVKTLRKVDRLSTHLKSTLDHVFEYQVNENSLYERVYETKKILKEPVPSLVTESKAKISFAPKQDLLKAKSLKVHCENTNSAVSVESPSLVKNEKQVTLSLALRNKGHVRADGTIWAVVEWEDSQGRIRTEYSPEPIPGKHSEQNPNSNTFSIRQYKVKKFPFLVPDQNSTLSKIEVWLSDRNSNRTKFEVLSTFAH